MSITEKDVTRVADLANLELTAEERVRLVRDLNSILDYIDRLNELDTGNIAAMAQTSDRFGVAHKKGSERFAYASRQDVVKPSLPREAALGNAPESDGKFFKVPKVIER
jgi:aspartyl-tRNA(Asn)/glutamyl-tRNA(Gln) amidotransferase subunit C